MCMCVYLYCCENNVLQQQFSFPYPMSKHVDYIVVTFYNFKEIRHRIASDFYKQHTILSLSKKRRFLHAKL